MLQFQYVARERTGQQVKGTIAAGTKEEAARLIRERSLFPVQIETASGASFRKRSKRVPARALARFYSQLSDLMKSGVPLLRCLEVLSRQFSTTRLGDVLLDIRKNVSDGQTLADAMNQHNEIFGELAISMVRAGQEGGFLEDVFRRIALFTERQEDLKGRVMGTLAYPMVLLLVGSMVITVLLVYFVPKFSKIFDRLREQGELPAMTEWLLAFSETIQNYGLIIVAAAIVLGLLGYRKAQTPGGRRFIDTWKLRLPLLGMVTRDLAITRFNRILGTLRRNGIPILTALRIAKDSTGNVLMKEAIEKAADNVQAGDKLATPLRASNVFPIEIVEMIEVGEESNNLENVLLDSADGLESRTTRQLDIAVRLLEPLMLLFMAAITLVVVIALLLPIFKMSRALHK